MSAAGRLWRRAPIWRLALLSAIGLTGLAVMFPPTVPPVHWPVPAARHTGPNDAHFHPKTVPTAPDDAGLIQMPPPGPTRSGLVPFAGRLLPLPAGAWQTITVVSSAAGEQQLLLARIVNHHLTALVMVVGTGVFGGPAGPIGVPAQCANPDRLAGAIIPAAPMQSPLLHECWSIVPADMKAVAGDGDGPVLARALGRFGEFGVAVPDRMLAVQFVRSTDRGWQATAVMVPDAGGPITALSAWAGRYLALLHKGFDRTATTADLTPAAVTIP